MFIVRRYQKRREETIMNLCKLYITEQEWEWNKKKKDLIKPNYDLVKEFLKKGNPKEYDFKLENDSLKGKTDGLIRELTFKKNPNGFDPDCSELCMSLQCVLLQAKGIEVIGYNGRTIIVFREGRYEILETDTINSFWTLYKKALQTNIPNYWQICKKHNIKGSLKDNLRIVIDNIGEFDIGKNNKDLAAEINRFACLTHSIGNFVVGPSGFNCQDEYSKANLHRNNDWSNFDRIDLFLGSLMNSWHQDW